MASLFTRRSSRQNELTAAAALSIGNPNDRARLQSYLAFGKGTVGRAWKWYECLPEVNYAIEHGSALAGKAQIKAYRRGPDGRPGELVEDGPAAKIATEMYSPFGDQAHLIGEFFALRRITGEAHLLRNRGDGIDGVEGVDGYDFVSSNELNMDGDRLMRTVLPASAGVDAFTVEVPPEDYIGRVWNPSFKFVEQAKSPLQAIDIVCEELYLLTLGLKSKLLNRLALAGMMFIPSELSEVVPAATAGLEDGENQFHNDIVIDALIKSMVVAVRNHDEPRASLPIIIRGPGEHGEKIRWITMDREILETEMNLRAEAVRRILAGLDIQPEMVTGVGTSNHWDAWAIMEQDVRLNTEPDLQALMWTLNRLVFWPQMIEGRANGEHDLPAEEFMLWYDLTAMTTPVNVAENARQAWDRITLNDAELRRVSGFDEEHAPDDMETLRAIGKKTGVAYFALYGTPLWDKIDWDEADKHSGRGVRGPVPDSSSTDSPAGPGVGTPGSPAPSDNESDTPKADKPQQ